MAIGPYSSLVLGSPYQKEVYQAEKALYRPDGRYFVYNPYQASWDVYTHEHAHAVLRRNREWWDKNVKGPYYGVNRSLMEELLWDDKVRKRHSARVRQSLRATSPAATAEQMWAGYSLKVRELTKQERAHRRELRWMLGYWGADAYNLPNYDKVWGNWMQVHTQPLHARKKLYRDITGKTFYGVAIPVRGQR